MDREWKPGFWATTGGSVLSGETSLQGAVRETIEEVGLAINENQLRLVERNFRTDSVFDIWVARIKGPTTEPVSNDEVIEIKWVPVDEIKRMIGEGTFVDYWTEEKYKTELGEIK